MGAQMCRECAQDSKNNSNDLTVSGAPQRPDTDSVAIKAKTPAPAPVAPQAAQPETVKAPTPTPTPKVEETKPKVEEAPAPTPTPAPAPEPVKAPAPAPAAPSGPQQLDVKITRSEGQSLGLVVDCSNFVNLILVRKVKDGPAQGKVQVGDFITAVDGDKNLAGQKFSSKLKSSQNPTLSISRHTWEVQLKKTPGTKLGMSFSKLAEKKYASVTAVKEGGALEAWNKANPNMSLKIGDTLLGVNGSHLQLDEDNSTYDAILKEATQDNASVNLTACRRPGY